MLRQYWHTKSQAKLFWWSAGAGLSVGNDMSITMLAQCSCIDWGAGTSRSRQARKGAATACPNNTESVMKIRNLEGFLYDIRFTRVVTGAKPALGQASTLQKCGQYKISDTLTLIYASATFLPLLQVLALRLAPFVTYSFNSFSKSRY
jgi:hypothetical protein